MSIKVDLWTDIACPWCYVGHKSFKNSIINFKKKNPLCKIELTIHPYMIDPNTKKEGEDYEEKTLFCVDGGFDGSPCCYCGSGFCRDGQDRCL